MGLWEVSIFHHICIVIVVLCLFAYINYFHPLVYFVSLIYLYLVHDRYVMRLRRNLRYEERKHSNQRRVLTDSETVRWMNFAAETMWPICMEQIVSQKILLPIVPWFLQKYKPWTVKEAVVQHLYMGRSPPMLTEIKVVHQSTGDDHLVLEIGLDFRSADDMNAILGVKLRKRLGFGMWTKMHLMGMHVEGKILIGVKFLRGWPFLGRIRICFVEPPYFQMIVKPIFTHELDVTELPGIAGWLDKLLALAFEETLVEPNMLVVDMEKFASPQSGSWFSVDAKEPVAYAMVEVIEAMDVKPSDSNGLADPYVKGQLGPYRFSTKTQKKTLAPKWHEEFKIPICSWEAPNMLAIIVRDKDLSVDDSLGECCINIGDLRDGQRHDMWLHLRNIKMGRLHLTITVVENNWKDPGNSCDGEIDVHSQMNVGAKDSTAQKSHVSSGSSEKSPTVGDKFDPIDIEGQEQTGIWVHHPGKEDPLKWEPRKGRDRLLDAPIHGEEKDCVERTESSASGSYHYGSSGTDDSNENRGGHHRRHKMVKGLRKIGTLIHRHHHKKDPFSGSEEPISSPHANLKDINATQISLKLVVDENNYCTPSHLPSSVKVVKPEVAEMSQGRGGLDSPKRRNLKEKAKSIFKHAKKPADGVKHAFAHKRSNFFEGRSSSEVTTERDYSQLSESSHEGDRNKVA